MNAGQRFKSFLEWLSEDPQDFVHPVSKARNAVTFGDLIISRMHTAYAQVADDGLALGYFKDDTERKQVGKDVGVALDAYKQELMKHGLWDIQIAPDDIDHILRKSEEEVFALIQKAMPLFSSPGGKSTIANQLVGMFPEHATYVEPFAGSAAVFFAKDKVRKEVLNDLDNEVAFTLRKVSTLTDEEIAKLGKYDWGITRERFVRIRDMEKAGSDLGRVYKFLYLRGSSYGGMGKSYQTRRDGDTLQIVRRIPMARDRLRGALVTQLDAVAVITKYDSPNTFFYIDPPYPSEWKPNMGVTFSEDDLDRLIKVLKRVRGKFMLSLDKKDLKQVPSGFEVRKLKMRRSLHTAPTQGQDAHREDIEIIVANYPMGANEDAQKSDATAVDVHVDGLLDLSKPGGKAPASFKNLSPDKRKRAMEIFNGILEGGQEEGVAIATALARVKAEHSIEDEDEELEKATVEIVKSEDERRLVWVVVMVPDKVDHEKQWASADTIEKACHSWMLNGSKVFLEHSVPIDSVKVVENYTLLDDLNLDGRVVKKGSWIAVMHIPNDAVWKMIQSGQLKGGSVRGLSKLRDNKPDDEAA